VIESGNRRNHSDRFEHGEGMPIVARRRQSHRDFAPGTDPQFVDRVPHAGDRAVDLDESVRQWLAALARDLAAEMLALPCHQYRKPAQDVRPLMRLEPSVAVGELPLGPSILRSSAAASSASMCVMGARSNA
jgi:hypothetical protein